MCTCSALPEQSKSKAQLQGALRKGLSAGTFQDCVSVLDSKKPDQSLAYPSAWVKFLFLGILWLLPFCSPHWMPNTQGVQKEGQCFWGRAQGGWSIGSTATLYLVFISLAASENLQLTSVGYPEQLQGMGAQAVSWLTNLDLSQTKCISFYY